MPGRKFYVGSNYRYGFNGKEKDNDIGVGAHDYGMRIYDGRLGRFLSIDPLIEDYPYYSPFQFAGNGPIELIDIDGGEGGKLLDALIEISDAITDFFSFKSEKAEIKEGSENIVAGVNQQIIGPWNAPQIFNSENPGLTIELNRINGQIQSTTGVVQISSGIQGISQKVQTVVEVPLIIKNTSKPAIQKVASNVTKEVKSTASPQATKTVANKITGYTKHGLNQAIGRDGGKGANIRAILDAVENPKVVKPGSSGGATAYKGKMATVVLNDDGKVVTTMSHGKGNTRGQKQRSYHSPNRSSGSGSAQRKGNK